MVVAMSDYFDYIGHIRLDPPLNAAESEYLTAFAETTHVAEDPSPYFVSDNPRAPKDVGGQGWTVLNRRDDMPDACCAWIPSCRGRCLTVENKGGQTRGAADWLRWLTDHFLKPNAKAASSGNPEFQAFTFDHRLEAMVAAHSGNSGRLWLIGAEEYDVWERDLWPGEYDYK
jgi:hypothetical protein